MTQAPSSPVIRLRLVAALAAGVTVLLAAGYYFVLRQEYTLVYQDLSPADAAAITGALQRASIPYRIAGDGDRVLVPTADAERVRAEIGVSNIRLNDLDGFELFNDSDMGLTDFAQKIKYQRALQGELARTIMMMDGVLEARVHISMPERTLFRGERRNAEAAVTIVTRTLADATQSRIEGVQRLVAASVSDLSVSDVVVLNAHGEVISAPDPEPTPTTATAGIESAVIRVARDAIRRAVPDRPFEVTVETQTPPPDLDGAASDGEPSPSRRVAIVSAPFPLSDEQRARVRAELYAANFGDGVVIEGVQFHFAPAAAAPAQASPDPLAVPPPSQRAEADAPQASPLEIVAWIASAILVLALAIVCVFALRGGFVRRRLSLEEHESFAERLKQGLHLQQQELADGGR